MNEYQPTIIETGLLLDHRQRRAQVRRHRADLQRRECGLDVGGPALAVVQGRGQQPHDPRADFGRAWRWRGRRTGGEQDECCEQRAMGLQIQCSEMDGFGAR